MEGTCFLNFIPVIFFLLSFKVCNAIGASNITIDQAALLALKVHISNPRNILANNWSTNVSVCSWIGVTCGAHGDRVRALDLSDMGLYGTIPSEIGNLSFLAFLSIRNNNFYGSLPKELAHLLHLKHLDFGFNFLNGSIPPSIASLPKLRSLLLEANVFVENFPLSLCNISSLKRINISHNQLSGFMYSSIFSASSLEVIDLSYNGLSGEIPADLFNYLPKLQGLYLSRNQLNGSIPRTTGNCTMIKEINFSGNNLTGLIPAEFGGLANLELLIIHENALSGTIPSALFNMSTMKAIEMFANHLSGSLPSTMGHFLPNLRELRLGGNELEGAIPSSISNASLLAILDLSYNSFTGLIPATLGNLRYLQKLNLANNYLSHKSSATESSLFSSLENCKNLTTINLSGNLLNATLPISIGNLSSLEQLWANNCNIKGSIPSEISNLTSLIALSLANNELTGIVPNPIQRLTKLQVLNIQGNQLQGAITDDLCHLDNLYDLSLGGNKLFGSIPECLGNLTALRHLNLSSNNLTSQIPLSFWSITDILSINLSSNSLSGTLPSIISELRVAEKIDLSRNQLSGEIPNNIGDLKNLGHLSLARNRLQGPIPVSLNLSVSLESLDLSYNNLSGPIPKSLETLLHLKYFNVSFNGLEGEIPNAGPFMNFSAQSYMMNKALCGSAHLQVPACKTNVLHGSTKTLTFFLEFILPLIAATMVALYIFIWLRCPKRNRPLSMASVSTRYTYRELLQATDGFSAGNLLGRGSFGSVYKGTLSDGKVVAIKVFNAEMEASWRSFIVERDVLCNTCHPNLITIFCSSNAANFKALVMEYMVNGSLEKWLYTHNYRLDILQRLDIMIDTASAVDHLHSDSTRIIVHGDLKPSNILLDEDMIARLSDFSIAKFINSNQQNAATVSRFLGTVGYVAPECGFFGTISTKTDVYSFGIVLMETFTRKKPTDQMFADEMTLRQWVIEALPNEIERVVDPCLLQNEEEHFQAKTRCLSDIMRLALMCSSELPVTRLNMNDVVHTLNGIKRLFIRNISGDNSGVPNLEVFDPDRIGNNMRKFVKWRRENLLPSLDWHLPDDNQNQTNR